MKNKGFTLIELLAVIVILAIIALIAVPIILNIIGDTKESSDLRSAELYLDAVEKAVARYNLTGEFPANTNCTTTATGISCTGVDGTIVVDIDGTRPEAGGTIVFSNGKVANGTTLTYGTGDQAKTFNYDGTKLVLGSSDSTDEEVCEVTNVKSFGNSCTYEDLDSSGNITVGDKVTCGTESFYVIENPAADTVKMLAEWNLNVNEAGDLDGFDGVPYSYTYCASTVGYQDEHVRGSLGDEPDESLLPYTYTITAEFEGQTITAPWAYGAVKFDRVTTGDNGYWTTGDNHGLNTSYGNSYPAYVYGSNSTIKPYVYTYVEYLNSAISEANATGRLINVTELEALGCSMSDMTCSDSPATAPSWVYQTSYWSGSACSSGSMWSVGSNGNLENIDFVVGEDYGVRPVIEISESLINAS